MILSTVNVNNIIASPNTSANTTTENNDLCNLVVHNLKILHQCHQNGTRYRIRRGLYNGRKVAIIMEARTCLDKLFSHFPSFSSLKERFSSALVTFIGNNREINDLTVNYLRYGVKLPDVSTAEVLRLYAPTDVYNPWPHLPKTLRCNEYSVYGDQFDPNNPEHMTFSDQEKKNKIFSNMYKRADHKQLAFVDVPGVVTTLQCPEVYFQAGGYYNQPRIRKAILCTRDGTTARFAANNFAPYGGTRIFSGSRLDSRYCSENRDTQLMVKIVRTRAQQDLKFRTALKNSGTKLIFKIDTEDGKHGCVKNVPPYEYKDTNAPYAGLNGQGQILMMVRDEINNNQLPRKSTKSVQRMLGIDQKA